MVVRRVCWKLTAPRVHPPAARAAWSTWQDSRAAANTCQHSADNPTNTHTHISLPTHQAVQHEKQSRALKDDANWLARPRCLAGQGVHRAAQAHQGNLAASRWEGGRAGRWVTGGLQQAHVAAIASRLAARRATSARPPPAHHTSPALPSLALPLMADRLVPSAAAASWLVSPSFPTNDRDTMLRLQQVPRHSSQKCFLRRVEEWRHHQQQLQQRQHPPNHHHQRGKSRHSPVIGDQVECQRPRQMSLLSELLRQGGGRGRAPAGVSVWGTWWMGTAPAPRHPRRWAIS